jgi:7-cyano-7-deazaguanine synthase
MLWCHLHHVGEVSLAPLESNPFPDATPAFFDAYEAVVNRAVEGHVRVKRPYLGLHKTEVMRKGRELPLELTFSCIRPIAAKHCGACNKCAERRKAFADAGLPDRTAYHRE